ncbi:hypothetical protein CKO25_08170 [Thiocapsa imhoffii]|uniref:YprB ribonuclease H-like domain-containing protein n=1 Tax=Thiocapsa imhoffii TaxID=382777 RepID=A0A9X0WH58_9GAMM|nr:ribonuclease H-like domain-containing protein [Thiocapsa imhoffii]MBK1644624.1 hypothetical protein [Thiocapsa imhoffii]
MSQLSLKDRLGRLRGSPPAGATAPTAPAPSLAARLQRLTLGRARVETHSRSGGAALVEALGAVEVAPGVLRLERQFGARERHGQVALGPDGCASALAALDHGGPAPRVLEPLSGASLGRELLCLDTETSGLAGGTGTWAFVCGFLRGHAKGWTLRQYLLTRLDAEPAYLDAIAAELQPRALLISYNGRAFDIPLLTTRFRLAGLRDPFPDVPHLDLLQPVRRAYGRVWADCRLASVEQRLLGFVRQDDLPGAAAPAAWLDWLREGAVAPLAGVMRHNRWDLLSLAALLPRLGAVFADPLAHAADIRAIAAYHQSRGRTEQALDLLQSGRRRLTHAGLLELARLHRRRGDWEQARAIWEELDAADDATARTELAKYHEHRTRDLARALALARRLPPGPERDRRCARLGAKTR